MIATFAIGNSDDKLPQGMWAGYVADVYAAVGQAVREGARVHFAGFSEPGVPWQNALWAIELPAGLPEVGATLSGDLRELAGRYGQDSIAWWVADDVVMLEPVP
jgi:hypothetical protein